MTDTVMSNWIWAGALLAVVANLAALGITLHKTGQWVGTIATTIRSIEETLRAVNKDYRSLHKRVDEHDVVLSEHRTRLDYLGGRPPGNPNHGAYGGE